MDEPTIDGLLRATLDDARLSRGEKRALGEVIREVPAEHRARVRSHAFHLVLEGLGSALDRDRLGWLEDVVKLCDRPPEAPTTGAAEAHFSPGDACRHAIGRWLGLAGQQVDICVFTITDNLVTEEVLAAHRRRVKVRIITDNDKAFDKGSDIERFERVGIPLRVDKTEYHMHHKFVVVDRTTLLTGSYNWTRGAAEQNEENLIVTSDVRLVRPFVDEFERLWKTLE
jgi:phosphatidylserine/phosphatidylglycerophosphate/cardiolipin synthase-like enzyme